MDIIKLQLQPTNRPEKKKALNRSLSGWEVYLHLLILHQIFENLSQVLQLLTNSHIR